MKKAYLYGSEIEIIDFHLTKNIGLPYCRVRILESGWVENVPTSCIEIR